MSTVIKPFKSFLFYTGYVESSSVSGLLLTHQKGFNTVQEALMDIARVFRDVEKVQRENAYIPACCRTTQELDKEACFCSRCGRSFEAVAMSVSELFLDYAKGISDGTYDYWEGLESAGWIHATEKFDWPNHVFVESAETVIEESESWDRHGLPPDHSCYNSVQQWASSHVKFHNKKMSDRILK